jgi:integrase
VGNTGLTDEAKTEHRVPLTARCLEISRQAQELTKRSPLIFCHPKTKKPFSDAIFTSLLHKGLEVPYTMHGFRSSFQDWGSEKTNHPCELLEVSLAHLPGDQTEQAYWRGDMIKRRMALMKEWTGFAAS